MKANAGGSTGGNTGGSTGGNTGPTGGDGSNSSGGSTGSGADSECRPQGMPANITLHEKHVWCDLPGGDRECIPELACKEMNTAIPGGMGPGMGGDPNMGGASNMGGPSGPGGM